MNQQNMYTTAYHDEFHAIFPGISPCTCHQNDDFAEYNIDLIPGDMIGTERIIKMVKVQCRECGRQDTFNVESREVFERDINF